MNIKTLKVRIAGNAGFTTNSYLLSGAEDSSCAVVIDPGDEPELILEYLGTRTLEAILITHGHYDHIGGVSALAQATGAATYAHNADAEWITEHYEAMRKDFTRFAKKRAAHGSEQSSASQDEQSEVPIIDYLLEEGQHLDLAGLKLEVLHTPGHSPGSVCLYAAHEGVLFSGDTLFAGTCGRTDFKGGSPQQMHDSLARLATLPPATVVYPGHEGTTTIAAEQTRGLSEY